MTTPRASTLPSCTTDARIVLLGRRCDNTTTVATVLHESGINLAAGILAAPESAPEPGPAEHERYPVHRVPSPRATRLLLEHLQPDLVIAACYPWRLSRRSRAASRHGILNIHPSPLPHGRGPDPVFWVYRLGERGVGVTIHLMDDGLDSGPILAQQRIVVPEGMNAVTLERHLFEIGATMIAGLVSQVLTGDSVFLPQDELAATYQPAPAAHDWLISPLLPATWAWRFAQGVEPLHGPLMVQVQGKLVPVRKAISWGEHGSPPPNLPAGAIPIQFRPGWVVFEE